MRKYLFWFTLIINSPIFGQNHNIGLIGGPSVNNINGNGRFESTKSIPGYQVGITYQLVQKNNWIYGIQIQFAKRGFIENYTSKLLEQPDTSSFLVTNRYSFGYVSIPLSVGYSIGKSNSWSIHLGAIPSILIDANTKSEFLKYKQNQNLTSKVNRHDLAGYIEFDWTKSLNEQWLIHSGLRYQKSIINLTSDSFWPSNKIKHLGYCLQFGLRYRLEKK